MSSFDASRPPDAPQAPGAGGWGSAAGDGVDGHGGEVHLKDHVAVVRRRWWVVVVALSVAGAVGWRKHQAQIPVYTAEALIQVHGADSRLHNLGIAPAPAGGLLDLSSELEIVRSHSRLREVVDSMHLRLTVAAAGVQRSSVISEAYVEPDAPPVRVLLAGGREGASLLTESGGSVLDRAPSDEWLQGPGFRVRPVDRAWAEPIPLQLLHPLDAVARLRSGLRLEIAGGTNAMSGGANLIRIRYTDADPALAAAVPNVLAGIYRDLRANRSREAVRRRVEFIVGQMAQLADSVEAAELALMRYEQETGLVSPELRAGSAAADVATGERELQGLLFERDLLSTLVESLRQQDGEGEAFDRLALRASELLPGAGRAAYVRLQELEDERIRLTASRIGYAAGGPSVEVIDSLVEVTKSELVLAAEQSLDRLDLEIREAREQQRAVSEDLRALPAEAMAYRRLERRLNAVHEQYSTMLGSYYDARIAEAAELDEVEIVDPAPVPREPDRSSKSPLILALLAGLVVGVGGAMGLDRLDTAVRRPQDTAQTGLSVLGMIPELRMHENGTWRPVVLGGSATDPGAEAFRMLRTTLQYTRAEHPRVIVVSSAGPVEGKSSVAANLAVAFAHQGARTVLVDADFRRPTQHKVFGLSRAPGLSDVVVGSSVRGDAMADVAAHKLTVIPCGTTTPNPAELLGSQALAHLLTSLRDEFDVCVIDTPPVLAVTDAAVLATLADGTLLVAEVDGTDRRRLASAAQHLRQVRAPLLGIVLNRVPERELYARYREYYLYHEAGSTNGDPRGVRSSLRRVRRLLDRLH